jgi:hypothetical protein
MQGLLINIIERLDTVNDTDRFDPPCIFAEGGSKAVPNARAVICPCDENGSLVCPQDTALSYVLGVEQAKECIQVWSEWRDGKRPSPQDKFAAVMYYSRNDSWLPLE